jgi:cytoskeletal protein CcmA (bactofilin family)
MPQASRTSHLDGTDEEAMLALELDVTGIVRCDRVKAAGQVIMQDARIGGGLVFSGAHLDGKDKEALSAIGMAVAGDMLCNEDDEGDGAGERFRAAGGINMMNARIGGGLVFSGAHLDGKDGPALMAGGLTVTGQMSCYGVTAAGQVYMAGASIGGGLVFSGAHLDGKDKEALSAYRLTVAGSMLCNEDDKGDGTGKNFRADGGTSLAGASIGQLQDEKESWPKPEKSLPKPLELDG